jgi:hypothetical protein
LVGTSPPRIKWFRELWEGNISRPDFGSLSPFQTYFGDSDTGAGYVANVLSSADFYSLHFQRPGRWTVPLQAQLASSSNANAATSGWEVRNHLICNVVFVPCSFALSLSRADLL